MLAVLAELALGAFLCPLTPHHHPPRITAMFVSDYRSCLEVTKEPFIITQNFHDGRTGHILLRSLHVTWMGFSWSVLISTVSRDE